MTGSELLEYVLTNLSNTDKFLCSADEISAWPKEAVDHLIKAGLIESAPPTLIIDCDGCEQNCLMEVNVLPAQNKLPARAFISCDKRDDIGRVPVDFDRLQRWQITTESLAKLIAKLIGINASPYQQAGTKNWWIGIVRGKKNKSELILDGENLSFNVAGHNIDVVDLLSFKAEKLELDKDKLINLVNAPKSSKRTPADRKKYYHERRDQLSAKGIGNFIEVLAREEGVSESAIKQVLYRKPKQPSSASKPKK